MPSSSYHPCIGSFFDFGLHELFSLHAYACPGVLFGVYQIRGKERAVWLLARSLMGILIWSIGDYCKLTEHDGASPIRGAPRLCSAFGGACMGYGGLVNGAITSKMVKPRSGENPPPPPQPAIESWRLFISAFVCCPHFLYVCMWFPLFSVFLWACLRVCFSFFLSFFLSLSLSFGFRLRC